VLELLDQVSPGAKAGRRSARRAGSIFDLAADGPGQPTRHHAEIANGEFEKPELLRLEKEVLGLYVSEHPLHAIRDQLRRKTDCALAELDRRRGREVVVVGGSSVTCAS